MILKNKSIIKRILKQFLFFQHRYFKIHAMNTFKIELKTSTATKMLILLFVLLFSIKIFAGNVTWSESAVLTFNCPQDITIACWQDYENTQVTGHPKNINVGQWYFTFEDEVHLSPCREGYVIRTWTGTNPVGQWTCEQTITMVYEDYFNGQIQWPQDWTGNCDEEIPFAEPVYNPGFCDMIAHTYNDDTINLSGNVCYKILRNWKVIDCWRYNPNSNSGLGQWLHTQVLTVIKQQKPVFNECATREIGAMNNNCTASFHLSKSANDSQCGNTSKLKWKVTVDYFSCFGIDTTIYGEGDSLDIYLKNLGTGTHKVYWEVYDHCGNVSQCEETVIITDKKAPTPFCYLGSHTILMPVSGMLEVHAREYVKDAKDNCTAKDDLRYSWRINPKDSVRIFTCNDLGFQFLPIYVFDDAGNRDHCFIFTRVEIHGDCNPGQNLVQGMISEMDGTPARNVLVKLGLEEENTFVVDTSDLQGMSSFVYVDSNPETRLFVERSSAVNPGYSTLDLVVLYRYLLGLYLPGSDSLFLWAADVNADQKVNVQDLIELRKVILGQTHEINGSSSPVKIIVRDAGQSEAWIETSSIKGFNNGFDLRILSRGQLKHFLSAD